MNVEYLMFLIEHHQAHHVRVGDVIFRRSAHDVCVQGTPFVLIRGASERYLLKRCEESFLMEVKITSLKDERSTQEKIQNSISTH